MTSAPATTRPVRGAAAHQGRRRPAWRPALPAGALLVLVGFAAAGWAHRWNGDDAFIVFRVVDHVLSGHGPVFNVGERVEAVTSPLWLAVLVGARLLVPVPVAWLAVVLGLCLAVGGLALAMAGAHRLAPRDGGPAVPAGALVWACLPPAWDYATSGLDGGLGLAWLGACTWILAGLATRDAVDRRMAVTTAVLLGAGPVVRPDHAIFTVVGLAAALALCRPLGRRVLLGMVLAAAALPVAVEVARMGYYAALVPTTMLAKEATRANWAQGWRYLRDFAVPYALIVPLAAVAVLTYSQVAGADRRRRVVRMALPLAGMLYAAAVVRGGGDFMHARLLLPALFAVLAPVAVVRVRSMVDTGAIALLCCWALLSAVVLRAPVGTTGPRDGISDQRGFYIQQSGTAHPVTLTDYRGYARVTRGERARALAAAGRRALIVDEEVHPLGADVGPPVVYEAGAVGLPGFAAGAQVHILDRLGLADAYTARQRLVVRRRPGHDKPLPLAWVWGRYGASGDVPAADAGAARAARTAMACPPLRRLDAAITAPLSARRFVDNVLAAPSLTALRFPSDPVAAAAELCGDR